MLHPAVKSSVAVRTINLERVIFLKFLNMLILGALQEKPLSGYNIIGLVHRRFDVLVSSDTVYFILYSLERKRLVNATLENRKRVYTITYQGAQTLETVGRANAEIHGLVQSLIMGNRQTS